MDRGILHVDFNAFYASVECFHRPEIRHLPVAVGGDPETRHGIILAKNEIAKKCGVKTGQALWQAKGACPQLVIVPPDYDQYVRYSRLGRQLYDEYTNQVEPFGLDECWLDVGGSRFIHGDAVKIANELRRRVKYEFGITASVGVSYNKVFAKLGSDLRKPDATSIITRENYKEVVWPLPVEDLLYVGHATKRKLNRLNIFTIGQLATANPDVLRDFLGKVGIMLYMFANGLDESEVCTQDVEHQIKGIGNSSTAPRDLVNDEDVKLLFYVLSESVAERLRDHGFRARTVQISIRDKELLSFERQGKLREAANLSSALAEKAMSLFRKNYKWEKAIRSIGIRATDLIPIVDDIQLSFIEDKESLSRKERLESSVDHLRRRFGHYIVSRASLLGDKGLNAVNPKDDHTIHPVAFFRDGGMPV